MLRNFLRSKIHGATVTEANLNYLGSLSIDEDLMELAGLAENEVVHIANVTNGARLTTYAIAAPRGSRVFCANGAAAHLVHAGDRIIIFAFGWLTEDEGRSHKPRLVFLDQKNDPMAARTREEHAALLDQKTEVDVCHSTA
jgi:aspartate 1-decarboxylase